MKDFDDILNKGLVSTSPPLLTWKAVSKPQAEFYYWSDRRLTDYKDAFAAPLLWAKIPNKN